MLKDMVRLNAEAREPLFARVNTGWGAAAKLLQARLWLQADGSAEGRRWSDAESAEAVDTRESTVHRVRRACVGWGLARAGSRKPPTGRPYRPLDGPQAAHVLAVPCSAPPEGRRRWTLKWLADKLVALDIVDRIRPAGVRTTRKHTRSNRGRTSPG